MDTDLLPEPIQVALRALEIIKALGYKRVSDNGWELRRPNGAIARSFNFSYLVELATNALRAYEAPHAVVVRAILDGECL